MATDGPVATVNADMERIFAPLAGRAVLASAGRTEPRRSPRPPRRAIAFVTAVSALTLTAAVAVGYDVGNMPPARSAEKKASAARSTAPERHGSVAVSPLAPTAQLAIARSPGPVAVGRAAPRASPVAPVRSPDRVVAPAPATMPALAQARVSSRPGEARCAVDDSGDECIYQDVLQADANLRRAYDRAARAGASPSWLAAVNRRWSRARTGIEDDPDGTIDRYERLADVLDDERQQLAQ